MSAFITEEGLQDESEGLDEANVKIPPQPNPDFPSRSLRVPDKVGSEDMCEHELNSRAVMMIAERELVVIINRCAEFRRTEKNDEWMAYKIWLEWRRF